MSTLRDNIIKKTIEFRDATKSMATLIPRAAFENKLDKKELDKKLQAQKSKDKLKDMQVITQELFAMLDELDVVEGRGLQR